MNPIPLPCPFCGGTAVDVVEGSTFRWRLASCAACGAAGPEIRAQTLGSGSRDIWERNAQRDAINEWNRRAAPLNSNDEEQV